MIFDPWSFRKDAISSHSGNLYKKSAFWTNVLLVMSNFVTAAFFLFNKVLIKEGAMKHFIALNVFVMFGLCSMAVIFEGAQLDVTQKHGLFGWLDARLAFWTIFMNGFVGTFIGVFGPIACMQFYSPVFCLNIFMLEPVIAQTIGCICGIDSMPGPLTITGYALITYGLYKINTRDTD